ncbi:uncharacterized protein GGS22DRAFT_91102 [Annulohypoxylon maeteangense]|uniref:uncharacterized protein n=1 Tax=Annulohypoxylon maeteangense TaxID=1927788 RepID=UPI0020075C37|nr:uncharacterized protein GGS22DRAFT_91102 [Annulohypoxylon maeteangense]KAI0887966.1 hypothetical protein GGS22DRAFT_91102 [Annulohypoxylon maeteangense]
MGYSPTPRGRGRSPCVDPECTPLIRKPIPCLLTTLSRVATGRVQKATYKDPPRERTAFELDQEEFNRHLYTGFIRELTRDYRKEPLGTSLGWFKDPVSKTSKLYIKDYFSGVVRPKIMKDAMWDNMSKAKLEQRRQEWQLAHAFEVDSDSDEDDQSDQSDEDDDFDDMSIQVNPPQSGNDETEDGDDAGTLSDHPGDDEESGDDDDSDHEDDPDDDNDYGDQDDDDHSVDDGDSDNNDDAGNNGGSGNDGGSSSDGDSGYQSDPEDDDDSSDHNDGKLPSSNTHEQDDVADGNESETSYSSYSCHPSEFDESDDDSPRRDLHCYNPTWVSRIIEEKPQAPVDESIFDLVRTPRGPMNPAMQVFAEWKREQYARNQERRRQVDDAFLAERRRLRATWAKVN